MSLVVGGFLLASVVGGCTAANPRFWLADAAGGDPAPGPGADGSRPETPSPDGRGPSVDGNGLDPGPADAGYPEPEIPAEDVRGYWIFDGPEAGSQVTDRSPAGHHGMLEGLDPAVAWSASGKFGKALQFPADRPNTAGVRVPLADAWRSFQRFTVAAWTYRPAASNEYTAIISRQLVGHFEVFSLMFRADQLTLFSYSPAQRSSLSVRADVGATIGQWVHVAATYDGQHFRIYAQGREVGALPHAEPLPESAEPLYIGTNRNTGQPHQPWLGLLDEVVFLTEALTAEQIRILAGGARLPLL